MMLIRTAPGVVDEGRFAGSAYPSYAYPAFYLYLYGMHKIKSSLHVFIKHAWDCNMYF